MSAGIGNIQNMEGNRIYKVQLLSKRSASECVGNDPGEKALSQNLIMLMSYTNDNITVQVTPTPARQPRSR